MAQNLNAANNFSLLPAVLVTGDLIIDHHIYEGARHHYGDSSPGVIVQPEMGGAGLVGKLLKECPGFKDNVFLERQMPEPGNDKDLAHHAYAFWRRLPQKAEAENQFWRCTEAMGFGDRKFAQDKEPSDEKKQNQPPCRCWQPNDQCPENPAIIVISEGGMGFRDEQSCWDGLPLDTASLIVLKTAWPVAQGGLWSKLDRAAYRAKLMVVVSAEELRKSNARINSGLSWETTFYDLLRETSDQGRLSDLARCRHLVVTFGTEGAAWFDFRKRAAKQKSSPAEDRVCFVYEAASIEHDRVKKTDGKAFGYASCITAALAHAAAIAEAEKKGDAANTDFGPAIEAGLAAMRSLLEKGHGSGTEKPQGFPAERLAGVIRNPDVCFTRAAMPLAGALEEFRDSRGVFLELAGRKEGDALEAALEFARLTALHGPIALYNLPHLRVGKFLTVDRSEIESLRTLSQVIWRYNKHDKGEKPLSIGVFGPPGAGKSFAVKELANEFLVKKGQWLEFNLSQFSSPDDLNGAFHQIRDWVLKGKLPVVFFDEFDSQQYHWLQYLLAPMQDGRFQQGEVTHTLGKCIFIFAGGTSWTFDTFGPPKPQLNAPENSETRKRYDQFRLAKGTDFKSRLDAFLNVVGPNRRAKEAPQGAKKGDAFEVSGHRLVDDQDDVWFPIRRALILRVDLGLQADELIGIDSGLLNAVLRAPRYEHGTRSLTKIIAAFKIVLPAPIQPSSLPPSHQLAMHTDVKDFNKLLSDSERARLLAAPALSPNDQKKIAYMIHETWRKLSRRMRTLKKEDDLSFDQFPDEDKALQKVQQIDRKLKSKSFAGKSREQLEKEKVEIERLAFRKRSNFAAAERMPRILAVAGLQLVRNTGKESRADAMAVRQHIEYHLELLANAEHLGWMQWHFDNGWAYHPERKDEKQRHNCLKPFTQLKESDRAKDREQVRHFPDFLDHVGYKIVFA